MKTLFTLLLGGLLLAACGSSPGSLPEPAECSSPTPLPTSRATPGSVNLQAYLRSMRDGATALERLRADLRSRYADDTFYRRDEFRPDFASYADRTICLAQGMLQVSAPDARFEKFGSDLSVALTALIEHTRAGREAVAKRNVSDYRDWFNGADSKIAAVKTAANAPLNAPP